MRKYRPAKYKTIIKYLKKYLKLESYRYVLSRNYKGKTVKQNCLKN